MYIVIFQCHVCQIPVTYPTTAPEIVLPELNGKTAKMYRGGRICLTDHFKPLWARNVPKFGLAHAMALGVRNSQMVGHKRMYILLGAAFYVQTLHYCIVNKIRLV